MKRRLAVILISIFLMSATPVLAAYAASILLIEDGTTAYDMFPATVSMDVDFMAANGYISATGLDTRIGAGTTYIPHMLADDRALFATPVVISGSYAYEFTTGNTALASLDILTGFGGYITTADAIPLEMGDDFEIEFEGYIDTTSGADKFLVEKAVAFEEYISAAGDITASIVDIQPGFPQVAAVNGGNDAVGDTSHTVNLPAGIIADNLLIVLFVSDGNPTITFPGGWTELFQDDNGGAVTFGAWYRIADGGEGGTITVTTSNTQQAAHTSYRITDYQGVPEVGTSAIGNNNRPDPPSLTPTWGALNTLWFAVVGYDNARVTTVYPVNYINGRNDISNGGADGAGVGSAERDLNAASEDPGTFSLNLADQWVTNIIAIQPGVNVLATVTIAGVVSGEHTVTVLADTVNLSISVDGSIPAGAEIVALAGASVPDNANDYVWGQNNVAPYLDYITLDVASVEILRYEPVAFIVGTTLPDETGAAQDGTITWGANPGNVTVTLGSLIPDVDPFAGLTLDPPDIAGDIVDPADMFPTDVSMGTPGTIFDQIFIDMAAIANNTPIQLVWWFVYGLVSVLTIAIVYKGSHHLALAGFAQVVVGGMFVAAGIVPFWFIIMNVVAALGLMTAERMPSV